MLDRLKGISFAIVRRTLLWMTEPSALGTETLPPHLRVVYVLNNPLRNVDPDGLAEVPVWEKLSKELQGDLAKRLGGAKNAKDVRPQRGKGGLDR